jgi:hypothetical protein
MSFYDQIKKWRAQQQSWYPDLVQGILLTRERLIRMPAEAFSRIEEIRLGYRLMKIKKRLFDMYQILGRQTMDCLTGNAPLISEEEMERTYQRIALLLEDQRRMEAEIEEFQSVIADQRKELADSEEA